MPTPGDAAEENTGSPRSLERDESPMEAGRRQQAGKGDSLQKVVVDQTKKKSKEL